MILKETQNEQGAILKSYARNISTPAKMTTILKDVESNIDTQDIRTINSYIDAFSKLFVIDETESWTPKLRSLKLQSELQVQNILLIHP